MPTKSDRTAVTIRSWTAALKTPLVSGIRVLSEIFCIMFFISS